jgi:D-glycero-beta-D-manno-heptose-7-phosphate kinase
MKLPRIQQLLEAASGCKILVVGDVMLDEFVWGRVSRISPEAPVPVVEVQGESIYPGGAANVARNLRPFCRDVTLCGVTGVDAAGTRLRELLDSERINISALVAGSQVPTIVKTRIVARNQQVVRVDREKRGSVPEDLRTAVLGRIEELVTQVDAVILEDYGKGLIGQEFVRAVCAAAANAGKPVTADPNPGNPLVWQGVTVLKPNRAEAFALAGMPDPGAAEEPLEDTPLLAALEILLSTHEIPCVLVTLGEHGMLLCERDRPAYHIPTRAREVFDVSGAGDTAIALFTLALSAGADLREAAEISNHASGVVVGKLGTATLDKDELLAAVEASKARA